MSWFSTKDISRVNHGLFFRAIGNVQPTSGAWHTTYAITLPTIDIADFRALLYLTTQSTGNTK
jgi:hypothetical protein